MYSIVWRLNYSGWLVSLLVISLISPFNLEDKTGILIVSFICIFLTIYVKEKINKDINQRIFFTTLVTYFVLAYVLKMSYILYFPEYISFSKYFREDVIIATIPDAFYIFISGYIGFLLAFLLVANKTKKEIFPKNNRFYGKKNENGNFRFFASLIVLLICLLIFKYYINYVRDLGAPGVRGQVFQIPMITGFFTLLVKTGIFTLANYFLFYSIYYNRLFLFILSVIFVLLYVTMETMLGWKSAILYQLFIFAWYYFHFFARSTNKIHQKSQIINKGSKNFIPFRISSFVKKSKISKKINRKNIYLVFVFLVILTLPLISLYNYIQVYRIALLNGYQWSEAIAFASQFESSNSEPFLVSFFNRINGIDLILVGTKFLEGIQFSVFANFTSEIGDALHYILFEGKDAVTAFGLTQFTGLYLSLGIIGVLIGILILTILLILIYQIVIDKIVKIPDVIVAIQPLLFIMFIKVFFSVGNLGLAFKEIFLCIAIFYLFEKINHF